VRTARLRRTLVAGGATLAAVSAPSIAHAGAWTQAAGEGRAILTFRVSTADDVFDGGGHTISGPTFRKQELDLYTTYGLSDATTLVLQTTYTRLDPDAPAQGAAGFDETQIGLQQRLWHDDHQVVSAQATALLPGDSALTSHGTDWEVRGLYGRSFQVLHHQSFFDAEVAYRWRANGFADELRPELTVGVWLKPNLMVMAQSLNSFTTTSGASEYFAGEQQKLQGSAVFRLNDRAALQMGAFATVDGRNTPAERGALVSLWFDF
jgi:hypothetical protein